MPLKTFHGKRVGQGKGNGVKSGPQTDSSGISFCAETGSFRVPTPFPLGKSFYPRTNPTKSLIRAINLLPGNPSKNPRQRNHHPSRPPLPSCSASTQ